jgi:hypothetical protein
MSPVASRQLLRQSERMATHRILGNRPALKLRAGISTFQVGTKSYLILRVWIRLRETMDGYFKIPYPLSDDTDTILCDLSK